MAKISRQNHKLFGLSGSSDNFAKYGSLVAAAPIKSKDIATIQALSAWDQGWQSAIYGANKDLLLEDLNAWCFEHSYQVAYIFQEGIPEWNATTTYYLDSVVKGPAGGASAGQWFASLQDNNTGNAPPAGATNALWKWINPPIPDTPTVGNGLKSGDLSCKPNSGAPNSKYDVSVTTLSAQNVAMANVAVSADLAVSGANGLDAGSESANTWYYLFVICNNDGSLVAGLWSLSATAPTLPGSYTKFRRVGAAYNNGSSNLLQTFRIGDDVWYDDSSLHTFASPSGTVSFSTVVPTVSSEMKIVSIAVGTASPVAQSLAAKPTGGATPTITLVLVTDTGGTTYKASGIADCRLGSQQLDVTATNLTSWSISVLAYKDPI